MGTSINCSEGQSHHYIVNDDNVGTCKKCGYEKAFEEFPVPPKEIRRYLEISYELLRDYEFSKDTEGCEEDWYS